jgi:methionine sulfoxide reductase heme-binding subunit
VTAGVDPGEHLWWLASRSMGVVAMLLVSMSVAFGLAMSGKLVRGPGVASRLRAMHEALALSGLLAIVLHGLLLLPDGYLHPGLAGIAIPFVSSHRPVWTAAGVTAGWMSVVITGSFYVRRWIGVRTWRRLHRWTLVVWALGLAHTLGSGTDAGAAWLLAMLALSTAPVIVAGAHRIHTRGVGPLTASP